jgi:hypothetical protein
MSAATTGAIVERGPARPRSKRRDLAEIAIAYGLILAVIWTPRPLQQYLWLVAVASIAIIIGWSFEGFRAMGMRAGNFLRSLWVVGAALAVSAVSVVIAAHLHTLRHPENARLLIEGYGAYAIWSGVQQFLLQCFFLSRLLRLMPSPRTAAFTAAGLFALAHVPNPVLFVLTIVWGSLSCLIFLRYRNLYPLAMAHAILGVTIALVVPGYVDHNMRVGLGYLRYHRSPRLPLVQRSQRDQIVSTVAWVTADAPTRR